VACFSSPKNDRQRTSISPATHHKFTSENHVLHPVFAKTPSKSTKSTSKKNCSNPTIQVALSVGGAGVFGDEVRGESQVVLVAGGYEVAEDGVGF